MSQPRRSRNIAKILAIVIVLLALVIAGLPTLLNLGPGGAIVASALGARVNGTASVSRTGFGWFGPQSVEGLAITDRSGREVARLDVVLASGLLALALGGADDITVEVRGALDLAVREDGTTSLDDLMLAADAADAADPDATGAPDDSAPAPDEPFSVAGIPAVRVDVRGVRVALDLQDESATGALVLDDVTGSIDFAPTGSSTLDLKTATTAGTRTGTIEVHVRVDDLFDAARVLRPDSATLEASLTARSVPVPFAKQIEAVTELVMTAKSASLAERIDLTVDMDAAGVGAEPSTLSGSLALHRPIDAAGAVHVGLDTITGTVTGTRVPTALLQPLLASTPFVLSRDLGPALDVTARFEESEAPDGSRPVSIKLTADAASLELEAAIGKDGSARGGHILARAALDPELVAGLTGLTVGPGSAVEAKVTSFLVPARDQSGSVPLAALAFTGTVDLVDDLPVTLPGEHPAAVTARDLHLEISAGPLGDGVDLTGAGRIDDAHLRIDERITRLFADDGALDPARAEPVGDFWIEKLDAEPLAVLLGEGAAATAVREINRGESGAGSEERGAFNLHLITTTNADGLVANLIITADHLEAEVGVHRRADGVEVKDARARLTVTPALMAALQAGSEAPVGLPDGALVTATVEPFTLSGDSPAALALPAEPIRAKVAFTAKRIEHPALAEPVGIPELTADVFARAEDLASVRVTGEARLVRHGAERDLSSVLFSLDAPREGEPAVPVGTITALGLDVRELEVLLGIVPDLIAGWTGSTAEITVKSGLDELAAGYSLRTTTPTLQGELRAVLDEDAITLTTETLAFTAPAAGLERLLNAPPDGEEHAAASPSAPPRVRVAGDVPLTVSAGRIRLPLALLAGEAFDPAAADIEAVLTGGPLALADETGVITTVDGLSVTIRSEDLAQGIHASINGTARAGADGATGTLAIEGDVVNLMTAESTFDASAARLDLEATAQNVPTSIADAMLALDGVLTAAVGREMNATFTAAGFSTSTGTLDGRIDTTNGFLTANLRGENEALITSVEAPVHAELQLMPPLRDRVLKKIHPILADLRTVEQPLRFDVPVATVVPTDGDLKRLSGEIRLTIGAVEFDSGSLVLGLFKLFAQSEGKATIPGYIEPIVARIENGVITYERFAVKIDKYTLLYQGQVDLVAKTIDIKTEVPLEALAQSFKELEGYVDKISVPIYTRGSLDNPKTELDMDALARAAAEGGVRKGLGDLLGDLLGGGKKKDKDK